MMPNNSPDQMIIWSVETGPYSHINKCKNDDRVNEWR